MIYSHKELISVIDEVTNQISKRIFIENAQGSLYDYLEKINLEFLLMDDSYYKFVIPNRSKILIIGYQIKKDVLAQEAKKQGFDAKRIDFVEYHSGFDIKNLQYSQVYTDVLIGPIPHKARNIGESSSIIAMIEEQQEKYPKLIKLTNLGGELKITKNSFVDALYKTIYFRECM